MKHLIFLIILFAFGVIADYDCSKVIRNSTLHEIHHRHPYASRLTYMVTDSDFAISLRPNRDLSQRTAALRSFTSAARVLEELFKNTRVNGRITVAIGMSWMENSIIGATHSTDLSTWCDSPRGVIPDPLEEKSGMTFPSCGSVRFEQKAGTNYNNKIRYTKAHMKVLGYSDLDPFFGDVDGTITFNTHFNFDFDLSDGISPESTDFFSVCIHELMHLLGFISGLDNVDYGATEFSPTILDFARFRYADRGVDFHRDTRLASTAVRRHMFYIDAFRQTNRTGVTLSSGYNTGDGNQASHWGANEMYGKYIGVMDPTLKKGDFLTLTINDLLAFRLFGYSVDLTVKPVIYNIKMISSEYRDTVVVLANFVFSDSVICDYGNGEMMQATHLDGRGMWACLKPQTRSCKLRLLLGTGISSEWKDYGFFQDCPA